MRQFRTSLALPAVVAGIATLAGTAIAVGLITNPTPATDPPIGPAPVVSAQPMPGMSMPPAGGATAASRQDAPVATTAVAIQTFAFSPAIVTVKVGTTVTWTNRDQDAHTATAMSGAFHSPTLNTGQSYQYTFTTPGRFEYLCTIHPFMTATVVVTP
ncbi:MAG: cupredoxin domain-containing protein [Pseudonocardiales bacterium]|nr:cupredoxin domain-containing protein [Pseudonocardiales bacterium]